MTKIEALIEELEAVAGSLTPWEVQFLESVSDQVANGRQLSERQRSTLTKIHAERVLGW